VSPRISAVMHLDDRGLDGIESFVKSIVSTDSPMTIKLLVNRRPVP
jgi:hypothetical protein